MPSTSSLHVIAAPASRERRRARNRSNTLIQVPLHGPPDLAARTMQQDSLIRLRDLQDVTDLPGAPPFHVSQRDDLALAGRQGVDGPGYVIEALLRQEPRLGSAFPARGELGPSARPPVVRDTE